MLIDGKKIREEIKKTLEKQIKKSNRKLQIDFVSVGNSLLIDKYIELKQKFGEDIGVNTIVHKFSAGISGEELRKEIKNLILNKNVNSIVVQLPLPPHINTKEVLNLIPKEKDPDMLGFTAQVLFKSGGKEILPPVVGAVREIFNRNNISLKNKKIVIIGGGRLVGKPISVWLNNQKIKPTVIIKGNHLITYTKNADIIISGTGSPNIIKPNMIKEGVILIDVGTSSLNGQIVGDIEKRCSKKASLFSPIPGGVGPITIAMLFKNLILLNHKIS